VLVVVGVVAGRVKDGDADEAAGVDCILWVSIIVLAVLSFSTRARSYRWDATCRPETSSTAAPADSPLET
jgi:hypothetical protein